MINECMKDGIYEVFIAVPGKIKKENKRFLFNDKVNMNDYYVFTQYKILVKYCKSKNYVREISTNIKIPILNINVLNKGSFDIVSGFSYIRDKESYKIVKLNNKYKFFVVLENSVEMITDYYENEDYIGNMKKNKKSLKTKNKEGNVIDAINLFDLPSNSYNDKIMSYKNKKIDKIFDFLEDIKYVDKDNADRNKRLKL